MKTTRILEKILGILMVGSFFACNDYLDREPLTMVTPENYLTEESQLASYANNLYSTILPSHSNSGTGYGTYGMDMHTDKQAHKNYDNRYVPGQWKVEQTGGSWSFDMIYSCNYFIQNVVPKWQAGEMEGDETNIKQYIGEIYFLRAYEYFKKLQEFGDFPIVKTTLPDEMEPLVEASKRSPRNEVARFIISDLDSAALLLKDKPDDKKNRISKNCALLVKSRVALFEGTWLKYFKNTAFVPNGEGWPGKNKDYNAGYQYPLGDIDKEIDYFLSLAMESAKQVADNIPLVDNNGILQQTLADPTNPYFDMFSAEDMSGFSEVLLWRQYSKGLALTHGVVQQAQLGNDGVGPTRGMVNTFLMKNGLPIYNTASTYAGDDEISKVRENRDGRLWLFLKEPGQTNILYDSPENTHGTKVEPVPDITNGSAGWQYGTGYALRKGLNYDGKHCGNFLGYTGSITFRASEAYLNYMEACYEKTGTIDNVASGYWKQLRNRAFVDDDYNKTIAATDMSEEAKFDWSAYSAGQLIDPVLYNIRRERSSELMAEGFRYMDLKRWRSMDQLITTPYHIEGFKLWGPMQTWYDKPGGGTLLVYGLNDPAANVSAPSISPYLRPYEINSKSLVLNGYKWSMAHYLAPIAIQHFMITSTGEDVSNSPIYQNPGWPLVPNQGPTM
ncbi:RagB/SusD family nutrient uptake outer membrane protein [Parabacteroides sp. APC149_11_2_Y6]